jgi:hypothetical protein
MRNVISNFYSLEREITFIVKSEKEFVVLFAAGIELQSCCQDCLFILAVEVHYFLFFSACCILAAPLHITFPSYNSRFDYFFFLSFVFLSFPGKRLIMQFP